MIEKSNPEKDTSFVNKSVKINSFKNDSLNLNNKYTNDSLNLNNKYTNDSTNLNDKRIDDNQYN